MKTIPFWVDDFPRPDGLTSDLPDETDYLIVGSGLTGLSTGLRLAQSGAAVTIIDSGEIAGGASSINAGMVSPGVKAGVAAVYRAYGPAIGSEMWASTIRSIELIRELDSRSRIDALVHDGGMAALGRGPRSAALFEKGIVFYRQNFGVEWEVLSGAGVATVAGGEYFDSALYQPEGFGIHPARLSFGLAGEVKRAGALLVDRAEALTMTRTSTGHAVVTEKGEIRAGTLVLATNGYTTRRPHKDLARLVVPVGSYMIATEPLGPERAKRILPGGAMAYTPKRLLHYMRRSPDERILIGGRRNLNTDLDLEESARDLRRSLLTYWPELEDAELTHVWGGKLAVPFDLLPHIGRVDDAWYALGYAGHGVGLSVQVGHELAGMLLGEDPASVYAKIKHPARAYYNGKNPWFLSSASHLYRALDRIGR